MKAQAAPSRGLSALNRQVLSAALFPPAEWKGLLALSEGALRAAVHACAAPPNPPPPPPPQILTAPPPPPPPPPRCVQADSRCRRRPSRASARWARRCSSSGCRSPSSASSTPSSRRASWWNAPSALFDDSAPSVRPVWPWAQAAPTHPRAPPEQLGGLPGPSRAATAEQRASGRPKVERPPTHLAPQASSEAEWGGAGRNVEVGRKVRVDVMLQKAMEMYFGQMAVSRLNWEHNFDAAVPARARPTARAAPLPPPPGAAAQRARLCFRARVRAPSDAAYARVLDLPARPPSAGPGGAKDLAIVLGVPHRAAPDDRGSPQDQ